jgi:magnesium transporter
VHAQRHNFREKLYRPFNRQSSVAPATNEISPDSTALPTQVHRIVYNTQTFQTFDRIEWHQLSDVRQGVQWIDVAGLQDTAVLQQLGTIFNIHPLTLEDIVHTHQRPKVESFGDRFVVVMRMADEQIPPTLEQVSFVLCGRTLITFQEKPGDSFDAVRRRISNSLGKFRDLGPDYLLYCLIDASLDAFFPTLEAYGRLLEDLEDNLTTTPSHLLNTQIRNLKRELSTVRKISYAHREVMQHMAQGQGTQISDHTRVFFRDCVDHATQILEVTESFREVVTDLRDLSATLLSQRTNDVMRVLTIISTIFMPMSFIAGVYGMNFNTASIWNMPELNWKFGYFFSLSLMGLMASGMLLFFWGKGWLSR